MKKLALFLFLMQAANAFSQPFVSATSFPFSACSFNGDCNSGETCINGWCSTGPTAGGSCNGNGDCNTGETCINGWCSGGSIVGGSCNGNGDCHTGEVCINGWCS